MSLDMAPSEKPCQNSNCQSVAIYQCPRCQFRSCSLACCQEHKQRTKCNGKRDRTGFMPMHQMNDMTLTSDYFFLEDVMRQVKKPRNHSSIPSSTTTTTTNTGTELATHPLLQKVDSTTTERFARIPNNLPQKCRKLIQTAASRGTRVMVQPTGLSRHQENKSYVNKDGTIHWSVEIIQYMIERGDNDDDGNAATTQSERKIRLLKGPVAETSLVKEVLPTSTITTNKYYIRRFPSNTYQLVNIESTWKEILQDITVIEFPTIYSGPESRFTLAIQEVPS